MRGNYWNKALETASLSELKQSADKLLRAQLGVVSRNRFYKKKLQAARIHVGTIRDTDDLASLPFTTKEELRDSQKDSPPFGSHMNCEREEIRRVYLTSGTTGTPTFIGLTSEDVKSWTEMASRAYWAAGLRPESWVVSALGAGPFVAGATQDGIINIGCCLIPVGPGRTERILSAFLSGKADTLFCTPSYSLYLLEYCERKGIAPKSLGLQRIQYGGEPGWRPSLRRAIEESFSCVTAESLGIGDVSVDFWGECEERIGMHFCGQEFIYPELVEPRSGERLEWSDGTTGELVFTHVNRECVPLIRFKSGDLAKVVATDCPCGRRSPVIRVLSRLDDVFKIKGVTVYPGAVRDVVSEFRPRVTGEVEILLKSAKGASAAVPIRVAVGRLGKKFSRLKAEIEEAIHERLLFRADVILVPEAKMKRSEYKTRLVRVVESPKSFGQQ